MSIIDKIKLNGTTYDVGKIPDTTLTQPGQAADSAKVGAEFNKVKADLDAQVSDINVNFDFFGCYDLLRQFANYQDITKDGATFNWNTNKTECTVNGRATTTTCFNALYSSTNTLPPQLKAGETYIFRVHTTDPIRLRFYIYQYHSDSSLNGYTFITEDTVITLPSTLIGMVLRIQVISNTSVSNDKISVFITKTKSNTELTSAINMLPQPKGILPSDVALNDVTDSGVWFLNGNYDYTDSPLPHGKAGTLEVFIDGLCTVQRITRYDGVCVYYRTSNTQGSFVDRAWTELNKTDNTLTLSGVAADAKTTGDAINMLPQPKGILSYDVALNDVTDAGVWLINSGADYTDSPLPHGKAGVLEVVKNGSEVILQRITRYDGVCVYYRTSNARGSFVDRAWSELNNGDIYNNNYITEVYNNSYDVTCSPTITTDTNNFLASTGDTTDRTSAIQAMLNSTGICRLGAGDFYVTGVSIPDFGSLVGSGNATRLILDSSVTNGCAINLGNNCTVRDMRIVGKTTGTYTGQATVGTRHGILWTATADAESPTRKFRCIIDNCQFWHFAGGAITCSNVGGNIDSNLLVSNCFIYGCDAGINIAYYSEFHRITNVSVTHCYYGCICNGGNCNFVNCSFSYNMVGILMDNSTGQSPNNSHGIFSACTICHSGANNDGIAIKVLGCANGEIFTGLQIHFGSIIVDDSKAIRFVACQFGRNVPMTLTDNTLITFADCSVSDASSPTITQNGNTTIVFDRCYKYDGTIFNPVS